MPTKIDALLQELLDLRETIGGFRSDIKTLFKQGADDRAEREREHRENQIAMGEMRQSTAAAIAELRDVASRRYTDLTEVVKNQGAKLDDHARTVATMRPQIDGLQASRAKLLALASIGLIAIFVIGRAIESGLSLALGWIINHIR